MQQLRELMSDFASKYGTSNQNKRTDNVQITSRNVPTSTQSKSLCAKMDSNTFDSTQMDFYESDLAIERITSKLRADDLKLITSIPKISFSDGDKGNLDTPEISLNLSDFIDTPDLNKFASGEGLFPLTLTGSQEQELQIPTSASTSKVPSLAADAGKIKVTQPLKLSVKQEPVETPEVIEEVEVAVVDTENHSLLDPSHTASVTDVCMDIGLENYSGYANVIVKHESPGMEYIMIPEETVTTKYLPSDFDTVDAIVPTPVQQVEDDYLSDDLLGKSPSPGKSIVHKRELPKGSDEYRLKRERNNVAVRKSREKARERQRQTEQKVKGLTTENKQLHKKLELLNKELTVLRGLFSNANIRALLPTQHQRLLDKLTKQNQ